MPSVHFYVIDQASGFASSQGVYQLISGLAKRSVALGQVLILTPKDAVDSVNQALWQTPAEGFLPHGTTSDEPIWVHFELPAGFNGVCINLSPEPLLQATQAARIIELVRTSKASVERGRGHFTTYKTVGFDVTHHKV